MREFKFDWKEIIIWDIETLYENSLSCFYLPNNQWFEFSIDKNSNELYALARFIDQYKDYQFVGFNSLNFDSQVLEYILRSHQSWHDLKNLEITKRIWQFAQDVINDTNFGMFPPYREEDLTIQNIDLFRIHHFDNENRRCSLKWLEFMMDLSNIKEMPIHHKAENLTDSDLILIKKYCRNDILATHKFYEFTIGNTEHEFYRGKNKIQDRLDIIEEGLLPPKAINYSDSKIGDELNKLAYCKLTNKTYNELYDLKKKRGPTKKFTFGDCIPDYVKFKTPELQEFYESIKNVQVSLKPNDEQEFKLKFRKNQYIIARGGIHSKEKNRLIIPKANEILEDADVGSQYPNSIRKRKLFPVHLGIAWNKVGEINIQKRLEYKEKGESDRKFKSLADMYKLALNSGYFGKTIDLTNWQYGPEVGYFCTIGNQFEILMLIEMLELEGIKCVSANTDGIVCLYDKQLEERYYQICHLWEEIVGNQELGKLEFTRFSKLCQESVNHYIAIKSDGKAKKKGRFDWEGELNKNNTDKIGRIERKAICAYFEKNIPIEQTIKGSKCIFDFVRGRKSNRDYHYELIDRTSQKREIYKTVIRYYVTDNNKKLLKIKNPESLKTGPAVSECEAPDIDKIWCCEIINNIDPKADIKTYNIDYEFYIRKAEKIVMKIDKNYKKVTNQLNLF